MKKFAPFAIIVIITSIVYAGIWGGGFLRDDFPVITENPWITSPAYIPEIFSSTLWGFYSGDFVTGTSNYYRPVMHILLMGSYGIFKTNPAGYHGVNLAFHILNAFLVYLIASCVLHKNEGGESHVKTFPLIAALLFALHPANAEPVTWVAAIGELSFTFFFLLAFYLFILNSQRKVFVFYIASLIIYSIALFSKETATVIAPLFLLCGIAEGRPIVSAIKRGASFLVAAGVFALIRSSIVGPMSAEHSMGGFQYLLSILALSAQYAEKLIFPFSIKLYYPFHAPNAFQDIFSHELFFLVFAVLISAFWLLKASSRKTVAFFLLWIAMALAPPILMVKYIQGEWVFASRYMYFSIAGLSILTAFGLEKALKGRQIKAFYAVPVLIVLIPFSIESARSSRFWADEFSFWKKAAQDAPGSPTTHASLGVAYAEKKMFEDAVREYRLALEITPESAGIYSNLGVIYFQLKDFDSAVEAFSKALLYSKDESSAGLINTRMGMAYLEKGDFENAARHFEQAILKGTADANVYNMLGIAYARSGKTDVAYKAFSEAVKIDPQNMSARQNLERLK